MLLRKKHISKIFIFGITNLMFFMFSISPLQAQASNQTDISRNSSIEIEYQPGEDFTTVTQTITYEINSPKYFYSANTQFSILLQDYRVNPDESEKAFKKSTLKVSDSENEAITNYEIIEKPEGLELKVKRNKETTYDMPYMIKLTYKTHELTNIKGNITSIYVPGVSEQQQFTSNENGVLTEMNFNMKVIVPESAPIASEISPKTILEEFKDKKRIYSINGKDLIGKMGWIQFGNKQFNYFKITQFTPKTDYLIPTELNPLTNLLSTNIYKIVLPREFDENNQKIYYTKINPTPTKIEIDEEGNLIAQFEVPANENSKIVAEGVITMETLPSQKRNIPQINLTNYYELINDSTKNILDIEKYIESDIYWQKDSTEIITIAENLKSKSNTIEDLIRNNYNYVINSLEYDYEKVNSENPRLGALTALNIKSGVCMEYSDLMIAIFRAQGIPARTAFGYGNDPLINTSDNSFNTNSVSNSRIGHQWVQIWIPEYGWLSVDPTWGESGREYIGPDLDHILWSTVSNLSKNNVFDTYLFSANKVDASILSSFDIELKTINEQEFNDMKANGELKELSELKIAEQYPEHNDLTQNIKTTPLGKALVITLPSCIIIIILIFTLSVFTHLTRKIFTKSKVLSTN